MELNEGTVIDGRYVLKEFKGSGSFGEVWLAEDTTIGIDIAIKLYISLDRQGQDEFRDEYKVAFGLNHENLLTAQYYSVWDHRPYLTMKYCSRGSAAKLAGSATEDDIWRFIHDVAAGLKYLHSNEIIHQDIKPENILIDDLGTFLITDFGISKKMRSTLRKQSKRAVGSGAIAYMGPERFLKDPLTVKASDIWSLGVSIYELATGDLPFMGQGGGMLNAGAEIPGLGSNFSERLSLLMQACLAKETWDRPTAEQLVEYTRDVMKGDTRTFEQWKNRETEGGNGGATLPVTPRKKWPWMVATTAAVAVVVVAVMLFGGEDKEEQAIKGQYYRLTTLYNNNVEMGSPENYASLLKAKELLDSMAYLKDNYTFISEMQVSPTSQSVLNDKLHTAYNAWMRSAGGQYEVAEDVGTAISYYHIAAALTSTDEVKNALTDIANSHDCPGAYLGVTSTQIEYGQLLINYSGICTTDTHAVIQYKISSGPGDSSNAITGQAEMTIQPGNGQQVIISLNETPQQSQRYVELSSNGMTFYRQQSE